ncbi:sensor histidine kinase [Halorientalis halophila]|uniref:sensor histidine kinase n=1 Tax=Halorientalis halophila TaxID=3108499 RepID=UPI00300AE10E
MNRSRFASLTPLSITLVYVAVGGAWIAISDRLLVTFLSPGPVFDAVMTAKGWLFVAFSGVLLYAMLSYREREVRGARTQLERSRTQLSILHRVLRHNLRNHCTVVRSSTDLLEGEAVDDEVLARIERTTDDLVALSEKSRQLKAMLETDDEPRTVDLAADVRDLVADYEAAYPEVTFETDLPDAAPADVADRFDVVLAELVRNAIAHHDATAPTVSITIATDPGGEIRLDVADDGPGIPEMERGVLEDGTEEPLYHSQGLGLWIVRVFVQQSGGTVDVVDNEPRGTIVRLRLPAGDAAG